MCLGWAAGGMVEWRVIALTAVDRGRAIYSDDDGASWYYADDDSPATPKEMTLAEYVDRLPEAVRREYAILVRRATQHGE